MGDYRSRPYDAAEYRSQSEYGMDIVPASRAGQIQPYQPPPEGGYYYKAPPTKTKSNKLFGLNDPEVKRKKRVASYKVYTVEGKVKGSFRKSFRWLKDKYTEIVYGWW